MVTYSFPLAVGNDVDTVTGLLNLENLPNITSTTKFRIYTDIHHTESSDLIITLVPPMGSPIVLASLNGAGDGDGSVDIYAGVFWEDDAQLSVTNDVDSGLTQSPIQPLYPLSSLVGIDPNGEWTLVVQDKVPNLGGALYSWAIEIDGES